MNQNITILSNISPAGAGQNMNNIHEDEKHKLNSSNLNSIQDQISINDVLIFNHQPNLETPAFSQVVEVSNGQEQKIGQRDKAAIDGPNIQNSYLIKNQINSNESAGQIKNSQQLESDLISNSNKIQSKLMSKHLQQQINNRSFSPSEEENGPSTSNNFQDKQVIINAAEIREDYQIQQRQDSVLGESSDRGEQSPTKRAKGNSADPKLNTQQPNKIQPELVIYNDFKDFPHTKWNPQDAPERCPPDSYHDARGCENSEVMELMCKKGVEGKPILFDLQNNWLKGEQYAHILQNQDRYCSVFDARKYDQKQHPESIYIDPQDGLLYFVEGATIGSDFGFPRLGIRKRFKWKKMNFTTDLPKKDPLVSYIVASAVKCEKFFPGSNDDGPVYRMHAVILKKSDAKLQLPPLTPRGGRTDISIPFASNQLANSPENQDSTTKQQTQKSLHGRVITKSQKLKASGYNTKNDSPASIADPNTKNLNASMVKQEKNYILCHVRRVQGKKEEEEADSLGVFNAAAVHRDQNAQSQRTQQASKIPNKAKPNTNNQYGLGVEQQQSSSQKTGLKIDMKHIKKMSIPELKAAGLVQVDSEGNSVKLSTYKMRKLLEQQATLKQGSALKSDDSNQKKGNQSTVVKLEPSSGTKHDSRNRKRHAQNSSEQQHKQAARKNSSSSSSQEQKSGNHQTKKPVLLNPASHANNLNTGNQINQKQTQLTDLQLLANQQNLQSLFQGGTEATNQNGDQLNNQLQALTNLQNQYVNLGLAAGAINNLNAGGLGGLNSFGAPNPGSLSLQAAQYNQALTAQLAASNQLIGLGTNIGALNGLNGLALSGLGIGSLGTLGALQGLGNLNNLIGINGMNNINPLTNLQNLQAGILGQNQSLIGMQAQASVQSNQQQDSNTKPNSNENNNTNKKREQKTLRKYESNKLGESGNINHVSPNLNNPFKDPGVSPSLLPLGNISSLISGQNQGSGGGNSKQRKLTNDQSLSPWAGIADSLVKECTKEITRRLSGQNQNDDKQIDWDNKSSNFLNSFIPANERGKRRISTNSHIGRDRLNSAFRQYDAKSTNVDIQYGSKSPLTKGHQGEPSFGPGSKAGSNANQTGNNSQNRRSDEMKPNGKGATQTQDTKGEDQSNPQNQVQLLQQLTNMTGGSNTENNNQSAATSAIQQNQSLNSTQNFQQNLHNAILSNNQFFLTNPNFETEGASGNLNSAAQGNKKNSPMTDDGADTDQIQQNSVVAAAQQLQMYQQQQLLQTQQQLTYLNQLQQLHMAGQTVGNQQLGQLNQLNQLCGNGLSPGNVQELLQYQQLIQQQQQLDKDSKNAAKNDPQQISQQINIIQHQQISPMLKGGIFLNQSFGNGAKINQMQNNNSVKSQNQNNTRQRQLSFSQDQSPALAVKTSGPQKQSNSFLNQIKNALAADRSSCIPHDNKKDPSFTIHVPNNNLSHRESYFGSFGARKSQEGFNFGIRESIDQNSNLNVPNGGAGPHKFSICNAILSSINQNKSSKNGNNMGKHPDASPQSISPDKDDTQQESGNSNEKKMEELGHNSIKTPGQVLRGTGISEPHSGLIVKNIQSLPMINNQQAKQGGRNVGVANFGSNTMDAPGGSQSQFMSSMNNLNNQGSNTSNTFQMQSTKGNIDIDKANSQDQPQSNSHNR